jgi:hypothetical protein
MALPTTLTNVTTRKLASTISNLWTKIAANFLKPVSGTIQLSSNTTAKIGTLNGTDVNLQMPTIPAAANNGKLNLQVNTGTATQLFTANQSGNSTLTLKQGSNASLSVSSNTVTIAATDTKNTVGVGAVSSHEYGAYYYVPCVAGYQSSATNAQSYTEAGSTSLLAITEDPVAGWMANVGTSFMGLFASRPTSSMEGKIVTVNMDGILEVSSVAADSVALAANVEPLLTTARGVDKVKINPQQSGETNMRIAGFAATSSTGGTNNYGIWLGGGSGSLTYNNSYIISKIDPNASSSYGQAHKFSGLSQYAITANSATSATTANKVGNSLTLTIKSGTTEGTDKYTFNGSAGKTLNFAAGSNISLTAGTNSLTIAATNTKNTVGTGAATHTYDKYYYVPFTTSTQSAASNAQSYTELTGEMETRTPLLRFVDDPIKGMQGFMAGNLIGRFNGTPPANADGKLITVGMDGQLIVSSILDTDVALASNVEPLLTASRGVVKFSDSVTGAISGFYCGSSSGGSGKYGIYFGSNGGLTYNNSYIIYTISGDASGYTHLFEGIARYAYNAASASSASYSSSSGTARAVTDYGNTSGNTAIEIGWAGSSVTTATHFAVYADSSNGHAKAIKDLSVANARALILGTNQITMPAGSGTTEGYLCVQANDGNSGVNKTYLDSTSTKSGVYSKIGSSYEDWLIFTDGTDVTINSKGRLIVKGGSTLPGIVACGRIRLSSNSNSACGYKSITTNTDVGDGLSMGTGDIIIYVNNSTSSITLTYVNSRGATGQTYTLSSGNAKAFLCTSSTTSPPRYAGF